MRLLEESNRGLGLDGLDSGTDSREAAPDDDHMGTCGARAPPCPPAPRLEAWISCVSVSLCQTPSSCEAWRSSRCS